MSINTEQQFLESYTANTDALFRHILFRIGGDREKAKDILQDTFTRAWGALAGGKEIENLRAYFYRIAHNLIVDEYGRPKHASLEAMSESDENSEGGEGSGEIAIADASSHADTMASVESAELVRALAKLPADYRDVLTMRYIDDLGPGAIAEITGESANVISVRINRATAALREVLHIN